MATNIMTGDTDPFAELGGGFRLKSGDWVPASHSLAQQEQATGGGYQQPAGGAQVPAGQAPNTVQGAAGAAQTYSGAPGAAPSPYTANQGTQDVVRNTYLQRATQGTQIDRNDPNIRQQAEPYAAAVERARRQQISEAAERASARGLGESGAMDIERRMATERAGQATGQFESQLVGRELSNRRDEINDALGKLGGMLSADQMSALQRELAQLDAQLKRLGIETGAGTASAELSLRDKLGTGGLNIDLMRLLQSGQQFGDQLGFNIADREAYYNNLALQNLK